MVEDALAAILRVFRDTTVSREETRERLEQIIEEAEACIAALDTVDEYDTFVAGLHLLAGRTGLGRRIGNDNQEAGSS